MADEQESRLSGYSTERPEARGGVTLLLAVGVIALVALVGSALRWLFG